MHMYMSMCMCIVYGILAVLRYLYCRVSVTALGLEVELMLVRFLLE